MTTSTKTMIAGAVALNVPSLFAAAVLPAGALIAATATLTLLGAALGWLVGWSFSGGSHELINLYPVIEDEQQRAA
jgi:hypothetical protein